MPTTIVAVAFSLAALLFAPGRILSRVDAQSVEIPGVSRQAPKAPAVMPIGAINTSLGVLSGASGSFLSLPSDSFGVEAMGQASPLAAALSGVAIDALSPVMAPAERFSNESFVPPAPMAGLSAAPSPVLPGMRPPSSPHPATLDEAFVRETAGRGEGASEPSSQAAAELRWPKWLGERAGSDAPETPAASAGARTWARSLIRQSLGLRRAEPSVGVAESHQDPESNAARGIERRSFMPGRIFDRANSRMEKSEERETIAVDLNGTLEGRLDTRETRIGDSIRQDNLFLTPGQEQDLARLKAAGFRLALVTEAKRIWVERFFDLHPAVAPLFDRIVTAENYIGMTWRERLRYPKAAMLAWLDPSAKPLSILGYTRLIDNRRQAAPIARLDGYRLHLVDTFEPSVPASGASLRRAVDAILAGAHGPGVPSQAEMRWRRWIGVSSFLALLAFMLIHVPQIATNLFHLNLLAAILPLSVLGAATTFLQLTAPNAALIASLPWIAFTVGIFVCMLVLFDLASDQGAVVPALQQIFGMVAASVILATSWLASFAVLPTSPAYALLMPTPAFWIVVPLAVVGIGLYAARRVGWIENRRWNQVQRVSEILVFGVLAQAAWTLFAGPAALGMLLPGALATAGATGLFLIQRAGLLPAKWQRGLAWNRLVGGARILLSVYGLPAIILSNILFPASIGGLSLFSILLGMWGNLFALPQAFADRNGAWIWKSLHDGLIGSGGALYTLWHFGALHGGVLLGLTAVAVAFATLAWRRSAFRRPYGS